MSKGISTPAEKGDPRLIETMLKIMDAHAHYLGLDAPTKQEELVASDGPVAFEIRIGKEFDGVLNRPKLPWAHDDEGERGARALSGLNSILPVCAPGHGEAPLFLLMNCRSARREFEPENGLYSFALTMPSSGATAAGSGAGDAGSVAKARSGCDRRAFGRVGLSRPTLPTKK